MAFLGYHDFNSRLKSDCLLENAATAEKLLIETDMAVIQPVIIATVQFEKQQKSFPVVVPGTLEPSNCWQKKQNQQEK